MALTDIETIVIVIMENRSFDHMQGYLSLEGVMNVDGLSADSAWQSSFANEYDGKHHGVFPIDPQSEPCSDPQHDRQSIALQISKAPVGPGISRMGGFVESYATLSDPKPTDPSAVMGYFEAASVSTFDFFARNYCVCDHWFAPLPLGTQANRLMAMAGESKLLDNAAVFLPKQDLVYDWLTAHNIPWCAYQAGDFLPFFSLMASWIPEITTSLTLNQLVGGGRFRRYARLQDDWNTVAPMPSVIFVEPEYTDGPHVAPNDDHAPTGIQPGQAFLANLYQILISNPARWAKTLLVVTYDEHGGFFDHLPPLPIPTTIAGVTLNTTGIRVPAFLVSPYVQPGSVFTGALDHTSILQMLDDRFLKGEGYSVAVNKRQANFNRILNALNSPPRAGAAPQVARPAAAPTAPAQAIPSASRTPNAQAFQQAAHRMATDHPELIAQPGWEKLQQYLATPKPN
jgi:phospholipase C